MKNSNLIITEMKKINVLFAGMAVILMSSCGGVSTGKVSFNDVRDTVSYSMGMGRAVRSYKPQLEGQYGIDSVAMKSFVKGFADAAKDPENLSKLAYAIGYEIGCDEMTSAFEGLSAQLFGAESGTKFNKDNYLKGFIDGMLENYDIMTFEEADETSDRLYTYLSEQQFESNRKAGEEYLAKKAQEEGVVKTESGLLYKIIKEGEGPHPTEENEVEVNYRGSLINGTVFDQSKTPAHFRLGGVIPGWTEGLQLMNAGAKYEFYIPYELAYGDRNNGQIKPYSALVFEVELISFK